MFKAPFSFNGRIRRLEYALSALIAGVVSSIYTNIVILIVVGMSESVQNDETIVWIMLIAFLLYFPFLLWFSWAQNAKRCHDVGVSGWYQLIPFYGIYLLFAEGQYGTNPYGKNPKETTYLFNTTDLSPQSNDSHNSSASSYDDRKDEYASGSLNN
ncbi:Uncharacterized membrane protein YhaH, DUF805 family [Capnocytophaga haemolytica]|jgi:hypothetical protein|uniref:Predicted membrane protein n=1 Tax=Capnocytophaga haemolytica TaxID=45243 RepID=A0AAX2GVI1_9FLAO|nr:DUF805 domain-containing protein [Capnocytophaga haemolytica]SFN67151.1 Uncharacterized membrane protein YhaH, DUF805 family [Capnocytophaga haemolytica]SNV04750.1 Predicted membrane protein [Capnocytophaga haemolytica]